MRRPKLVFFGNERLATGINTTAPVLRSLVAAGYQIKLVVSSHTEGVSRSRRALEIVDVAHAYHIPVALPKRPEDVAARIKRTYAEAAILVAYGRIVPQRIIDLFPKGIINIHPSLLPKLRGSTPIETAILNGLDETGVSLMMLSAQMDAGPVYAQKKLPLSGNETKAALAARLADEGVGLLAEHLDDILSGRLEPKTQTEPEATYTRLLTKQDGLIDFKEPAFDIERKIRAFAGFPKARARLFGHSAILLEARVAANRSDGALVVPCLEGYLEILRLTAPSGKIITGAEFLRGYKK